MPNQVESKKSSISQIGLKKKLEKKEMIKETSQKKHAEDATVNSHAQNSIKHAAVNRGK